jgi:beta-galactosidase
VEEIMKKVNFNKDWRFVLNDGLDWDAKIEKWDEVVDLPHDFSIIQKRRPDSPTGAHGGFFQGGVGKYQKTFKAKKGKKYFIVWEYRPLSTKTLKVL